MMHWNRLVLSVLLILLCGARAAAQELDCGQLSLVLPEDWEVVGEPLRSGEICSFTVGKSDRSVLVATTLGPAKGRDAKAVAEEMARRLSVPDEPQERQGQYSLAVEINGQPGSCITAVEGDLCNFTCVLGKKPQDAAAVLVGFRSKSHPGLLPRF